MQATLENDTLDQCLKNIAQTLPNFRSRPTQQLMIKEVFQALSRSLEENTEGEAPIRHGESILVVEGPTGTGKSLGYLLPAITAAKIQGKHLVVSSATVMLQEQLAYKDIPFIAKHAGIEISYAIAKGRGRYACNQKLYHYLTNASQGDLLGHDPELASWERAPNPAEIQMLVQLANNLHNESWDGDRDALQRSIPDPVWSRITNDRHGCLKKDCPHFKQCPFYQAREKLEIVDVIIANHDLLLADLSMGGGVILPAPKDTFYCIDEAHHLADKAIKQFAGSHSILGTLAWLEKLPTTVAKIEVALKESNWTEKVSAVAEMISDSLRDVAVALNSITALNSLANKKADWRKPAIANNLSSQYRCMNGELPEGFSTFSNNLLPALKSLLTILSSLQENLRRNKAKSDMRAQEALLERLSIDLGFFSARIGNVHGVWSLLATDIPKHSPPIAKWFTAELSERGKDVEYTIHTSPVRAANLLADRFWRVAAGVILTSATLRSLGSFDKLLTEVGLVAYPQTKCLALESPFNLAEQGVLVIPKMQADPKNPDAHTKEVIALLPQLLNANKTEGALVLFSSKKQLLDVTQALPAALRKKLLIQGDQPKDALINEHFKRIENQQFSALFGLASFAEGLDLPGKACTHLIIIKLPFAVPDDPVSQTLAEWIEQRGGNAFAEMTLPETSIKLIQAVGRLIRSETDTGVVTILDTRLATQTYGRLLKKSLPPFKSIVFGKEQ